MIIKNLLKSTLKQAAILFSIVILSNTLNANSSSTQTIIDKYLKKNQYNGTVFIAKKGEVILKKAYGKSVFEFDLPNVVTTKFRIGSLTKQFTSMAIMILHDKGKLNINDHILKYFPNYPQGDSITIKHLLTHTSGIKNHTELKSFNDDRRVYSVELNKTIDTFKKLPLDFEPGKKFKYSNSGYILLGKIIEEVSGTSYKVFIHQKILKPLNMVNTGFIEPLDIIKNMANGYSLKNNKLMKSVYRNITNAHASGALYSTIEDLYLWDRSLYTENLIKKELIMEMFTPYTKHYGYGWGIVNIFGQKMVGHNGDTEGFKSNISRFLKDEICIILLSNLENASVGKIAVDLTAMIRGERKSKSESKKVYKIGPTVLKDYVGEYELKPNFIFTITKEGSRLYCQATGQNKLELYPESESMFFLKEVKAKIAFERDKNKNVIKLILYQGKHKVPAKKID